MFWIFLTIPAIAQEESSDDHSIIIEDTLPKTSASTEIIIDDTTPNIATIAELLQRQSSVFVRDMGGLGTQSTISIRGTSTRQNLILLNGIPLNPDGNSSVNLQDIPLRMLKTMTIYRSHSPLHLMSSTIGGVLDMQTMDQKTSSAHIGMDTWSNAWLRASSPFVLRQTTGNIFISGLFAENAYPYFDNRNTAFNTDDDRWKTRVNNDVTQGNILGTWSVGQTDIVHTEIYKQQGIPGHIIIPTPDIRLQNSRHLTGLHRSWSRETSHHDILMWHTRQREILDDSQANLGQGALMIDWSYHSVGIKGFHQGTNTEIWFPSLGWSSRIDTARENIKESNQQRLSQQIQLGQMVVTNRWEWSARINTHWLTTQADTLVFAPKTSILHHISERDHMWISLIRGFRPPDFHEIYGNQGAIIGNPDLRPEMGTNLDIGWTRQQDAHWINQAQIAIFARDTKDEIIFVQNAQRTSIPLNFERTRVLGIESDWTIQLPSVSWTGSLTFHQSTNLSSDRSLFGKTLPNLPQWMSGQQFWWNSNSFWLGTDFYWSDGNYWDASNQRKAPPRFIQNATIRWTPKNLQIEIAARNMWNRIVVETPIDPLHPDLGQQIEPVQDFLGYPLMGRSVALSLSWLPTSI